MLALYYAVSRATDYDIKCSIQKFLIESMCNKRENLRHNHVLITVFYLQYQKNIVCDQIRKSAISQVLQCHQKQLARINVTDLK